MADGSDPADINLAGQPWVRHQSINGTTKIARAFPEPRRLRRILIKRCCAGMVGRFDDVTLFSKHHGQPIEIAPASAVTVGHYDQRPDLQTWNSIANYRNSEEGTIFSDNRDFPVTVRWIPNGDVERPCSSFIDVDLTKSNGIGGVGECCSEEPVSDDKRHRDG